MSKDIELTVKEMVDKALVNMTLNYAVFADLVIKIGVKVVNTPAQRACAWTDGTGIYINEPMVNEIRYGNPDKPENKTYAFGFQEMIFVLSHELMHLLNLTFERGKKYGINKEDVSLENYMKFQLWNMATDYEINSLLINNRTNERNNPVGKFLECGLYDQKYIDVPAEKIYEELLKDQEKSMKQLQQSLQDIVQQMSNGSGEPNREFQGTEDGEGKGILLDAHMPILDDATKQEVLSKIHDCIANRNDGRTGSSAIDRAFEKTFKQEPFDWKGALSKYIRGYIKANYTWNKPSRSGQALGLILPSGAKTPKMHIGVAIDTSGSIGEKEYQSMINHVFTILGTFKHFEVDVWGCGTKVYEETLKKFTSGNKKELYNYTLKSDGCNDMEANIHFVNEKYKFDKLDALIIFSDFYDRLDGNEECTKCNCPIIFLCIDHKDFKKPSKLIGPVFHYEVEEKI